jgi:hypothetical protein
MTDKKKQETSLDREDWLYIAAMSCIGLGAGILHPAYGLIAVGVMLAGLPFVARMLAGKDPDQ